MKYAYGMDCFVGGVHPKKGGSQFNGIPIFTTVKEAKHFTQANETPLASTQWNDILCDKENQDKILSG